MSDLLRQPDHEARIEYYRLRAEKRLPLFDDLDTVEDDTYNEMKCIGCGASSGARSSAPLPMGWVRVLEALPGCSNPVVTVHCCSCYTRYGVGGMYPIEEVSEVA